MKKWKPERRDGLLLLGIGLGAAVGLLRGAVLAWLWAWRWGCVCGAGPEPAAEAVRIR